MESNQSIVTDSTEPCWAVELTRVQGFWYGARLMSSVNAVREKFKPKRDDDVVILASNPKTGTTWLKALSYCILFRDDEEEEEEDLLTKMNPHLAVPFLEADVYYVPSSREHLAEQGRLFNTHLPYSYLPDSIKNNCKVVYITRDPKDTLVSQWHFFNKIYNSHDPLTMEKAAEIFCNGRIPFGPYWDHVLEYWKVSQTSPEKVMFIKFEDLHHDPKVEVRKLASFLGKPFGDDDDAEVEKVIWRSSFDRLKDLDVNKTGKSYPMVAPLLTNNLFFRRGEVGDWRNHLTAEMAKRIDDVTREKFRSTGLYLDEDEEAI